MKLRQANRGHTRFAVGAPARHHSKANWRDVVCPTCNAPVKARCINQGLRTSPSDKGKPCKHPHPTRTRYAQKKWNEANL